MSLGKPTFLSTSKSKIETERFNAKVKKIADILMQPQRPAIEQIYGGMYVREKATGKSNMNKVCAMGLLMYHHDYNNKNVTWDDIVNFHCGIDGCTFRSGNDPTIYSYIIHLNDYHHLRFYQIGEELLKLCQQIDR
jgi:hypothetical protein